MKIRIKTNSSANETVIDPGVAKVLLEQCFLGVSFRTADGEELHVSMRDSGYELTYRANIRQPRQAVRLNNGYIDVETNPNYPGNPND